MNLRSLYLINQYKTRISRHPAFYHLVHRQKEVAESKGLVLRDCRGFWMSHKGDIEPVYDKQGQAPREGGRRHEEACARVKFKMIS